MNTIDMAGPKQLRSKSYVFFVLLSNCGESLSQISVVKLQSSPQ